MNDLSLDEQTLSNETDSAISDLQDDAIRESEEIERLTDALEQAQEDKSVLLVAMNEIARGKWTGAKERAIRAIEELESAGNGDPVCPDCLGFGGESKADGRIWEDCLTCRPKTVEDAGS